MAQLVEHHLAKVGVAGSSPVVRSSSYTGKANLLVRFFIFSEGSGLEPMRWNSVKKTAQWSVFRNSPEGFSLRGKGAHGATVSPVVRSSNYASKEDFLARFLFSVKVRGSNR